MPYQKYVTKNWFNVRFKPHYKPDGEEMEVAKVRVTALGAVKLHEWLLENHPNLLR